MVFQIALFVFREVALFYNSNFRAFLNSTKRPSNYELDISFWLYLDIEPLQKFSKYVEASECMIPIEEYKQWCLVSEEMKLFINVSLYEFSGSNPTRTSFS